MPRVKHIAVKGCLAKQYRGEDQLFDEAIPFDTLEQEQSTNVHA